MEDFAENFEIGGFEAELPSGTVNQSLVPEKHLDSPIIISLLERLLTLTDKALTEHKTARRTQYDPHRHNMISLFMRKNPQHSFSNIRRPLMQYSSALDFCIKTPVILDAKLYPLLYNYSSYSPYRLQNDYSLSIRIFEKELTAYANQLKGILSFEKIQEFKRTVTPPSALGEAVVISAARAQLWSDIVESYRSKYRNRSSIVKETFGPIRVIHCDGFSLIKSNEMSNWQLCVFEQLQMIQDCCLARHNVQLALRFGFHNGTTRLSRHVQRVIKWQERVLTVIGNDGFELVKAPEAIFKAHLNSLTEGDLLEYSSYNRTLDKMYKKERSLHGTEMLMREFHTIVQRVDSIYDAAELFGLSKLSGHPSVYAERSAKSVREEALPRGTIQPHAVKQMNRMFKHLTLSGYIRKRTSWPNFMCPPAIGTELRRHYLNQVTSLPMGSYPISDLDAIEFGQFIEYDYSEDYLKFLDDKAICPGASEMAKFWYSGTRQESRRLLQKILELEHFDTVALVHRLRKGGFTPDEMVVELTQKERELKCAARCFCKLPFSVRTFFTSTEYNLKEQFMKEYMPQQTMTMSATDTKKRMYNLVRDAKSRSRTLLEVDFSRWNLRWRQETVHGISRQLENIFGLPGVFSQAHPFFEAATVVLTDKHSLPEGADPGIPVTQWPEGSLIWRGRHKGGFEGIQQGLWTICTVAMMYWVLHDQQLSFLMAGQGDNQIFAITFDESTIPMDIQLRKLLAVMEVRCSLLNHEVKPDECIDSQTVLTYSKDIYVNGNHLLYNLKFASRSFRRDEIDVPSLSTEISGISASSMSCADSVYNTPRAIHWKTYHTIRLFSQRYRSAVYQAEHSQLARYLTDPSLLEFAMLLPGSLGGLPSMSWTRYFMKGEVDDLSWDVAAVRALVNDVPTLGWDLKHVIDGGYTADTPDLTQLLLDPHSIPIRRPKDLKRLIKQAVEDKLLDYTANKWIRQVASVENRGAGDQLLECLSQTVPLYPQIMSDVYSMSPAGVRDALVARFTMTRTIIGITGNPKFTVEIAAANARLLQFITDRYDDARRKKGTPTLPDTSYNTCVALRALWGPTVEHKNIGVYNPFDFKLAHTTDQLPMISASSRCESQFLHESIGVYPPNFGTKTKQKVSDHGFKIVTSSSTVKDLKSLILTHSELGATDTFARIISSITQARSPWTVSQLSTIFPTAYGGSAAHRHEAINASSFSLLGSRTVPTHLNFCSDNAGVLSGGEFDVPIAFQEFYLVLTNLFQVLTKSGLLDVNASIGFVMLPDYEQLPNDSVSCPVASLPKWSIYPSNKLCYIGKLAVTELPMIPYQSMMPHIESESLPSRVLIYNRLLAKYSRQSKLYRVTSTVNLPIELLDMKEFNHCPVNELITGTSWFIHNLAIHAAIIEFTRNANLVLPELLLAVAKSCASLMARSMLHPDFARTQFAISNNVVCEPGISGARVAADNLAGELYESALMHLRARTFLLQNVPLILFADYTQSIHYSSEIHSVGIIASQSFDPGKILLTDYQWLMIRSARYSTLSRQTPLYCALNYRAVVNQLSRPIKKKGPDEGTIPQMKLAYLSKTPEEAIRSLRQLPRDVRQLAQRSVNPSISFNSRAGLVEFSKLSVEGTLTPQHTCQPTTDRDRTFDRFLGLIQRPLGLYATALSIWYQLMSRLKRQIDGKRLLSIGVGHGAVITAGGMLGATSLIGVDLRSSFPCISQREGTYKPPEIIISGLAEQFHWSQFVSSHGGDILKLATRDQIEPADVVVIDIEKDTESFLNILPLFADGCCLIIRLICCRDWAQYITDMISPDFVYNTSMRQSHKQSYIFVCKRFNMCNLKANYHRIDLVHASAYSTSIAKDTKRAMRYVNRLLKPIGEKISIMSAPELITTSQRLRKRFLNSNTQQVESSIDVLATTLNNVAHAFRSLNTLTPDDVLSYTRTETRILCLWIANTHVPIDDVLKNIHEAHS